MSGLIVTVFPSCPTDLKDNHCIPLIFTCVRVVHSFTPTGNRPYAWNVVPEHNALGVCLERMHRAFSELVVLGQLYNPVDTGPRRVSTDEAASCTIKYSRGWSESRSLARLCSMFRPGGCGRR